MRRSHQALEAQFEIQALIGRLGLTMGPCTRIWSGSSSAIDRSMRMFAGIPVNLIVLCGVHRSLASKRPHAIEGKATLTVHFSLTGTLPATALAYALYGDAGRAGECVDGARLPPAVRCDRGR